MDNIENSLPHIPPFEALRLYFAQPLEACPTAMMDDYFIYLMETEQATREYNTLPFDGGLWDQPLQLLRIFSVIRSERNQYERIRFDKIKSKTKKGTSQAPNIPAFQESDLPPLGRNVE